MFIYALYLSIVVLLVCFSDLASSNRKLKVFSGGISCLGLLLISSLRADDVGKDLANYLETFGFSSSVDWRSLFYNRFEPGFLVFNKALAYISTNDRFFIVSTSLVTLMGPSFFIIRYSKYPALSFYLYVTMTFYAFSLSGIRHAVVVSILFFGYQLLINKKHVAFLCLVLFASLFHKVALFYIVAYPLVFMRFNARTLVLYLSLFALLYAFRGSVVGLMVGGDLFNQYAELVAVSDSYGYMVIMLSVLIVGLFFYKKVVSSNPDAATLYSMIALAALFQLFGSVATNATRASELFYVYSIVFIPEVISTLRSMEVRVASFVLVMTVTAIQYFWIFPGGGYGAFPYYFYWQ